MLCGADLREIRVVVTLGERLHFGQTADELGVTTSYVSQMLRRFEARLGGRVFERTSRRVELTPLGARLLAELRPAYLELDRVLQTAQSNPTGVTGTLLVGAYSPVVTGAHWVRIVRTFETENPDCRVEFVDFGLERNYLERLRAGEVEIIAARLPLSDPDLTVGPILSREPRVVAVAIGDPLTHHDSVSIEDLAGRAVTDIPAFPREMMDSFVPPATPSGRPLHRLAAHTLDETLMRVALGQQVHLTVPSWVAYHHHSDIAAVAIHDLPPSETALVWRTDKPSSRARAFAEIAAHPTFHEW